MPDEKLQWWQKPQWERLRQIIESGRNGTVRDLIYQDGLPISSGEVTSHRKGIDFNKELLGQ